MALDGIVLSSIVDELKQKLLYGKIEKIYQPEKDEIIISIHKNAHHKLLINANSNNPRIHLTGIKKDNPQTPPMFCMLLRKHIAGGKIIYIEQADLERIVNIGIQTYNELGDLCTEVLVVEIMGKHSNIILLQDDTILDGIKHVNREKSSVREILPGNKYILPPSQDKKNILNIDKTNLLSFIKNDVIKKAIYTSFTGFSPLISTEICNKLDLDYKLNINSLDEIQKNNLENELYTISQNINNKNYTPYMYIDDNDNLSDFYCFNLYKYIEYKKVKYDSISNLLDDFYTKKDLQIRMHQKTNDLRKTIQVKLDRCIKKNVILNEEFENSIDREKYKINGELLTAYIYKLEKGMTKVDLLNFYDNTSITIKLNPNYTPSQNAQYYFKKYNKEKRANISLAQQISKNKDEISYLESILSYLDAVQNIDDIQAIRLELMQEGYIKNKNVKKIKKIKSKPLHYISSDGLDIFVGKNNKQNDELTLKTANNNDLWFHTKDIPGSHVILKVNNTQDIDSSILEAAQLAAYYSKGKLSSNVPVDYAKRKYVKKPSGAKPGKVIYTNNKTLYVTPTSKIIDAIENVL